MLAASFFTGAILTWGIPLAVLVIVGIYWMVVIHRHSDEF